MGPAHVSETDIVHAVLRGRRGVMLDVGAHYGSSLAPFADDDWSIHAFEPDSANRARLQRAFGNFPNVIINSVAVSDAAGHLPLFSSSLSTGITSLAPFTATHELAEFVPVIALRDYLADARITTVDFLKIDVEGFERHVLNGYDWNVRPEVIVLEFEDAKTLPLGYSWRHLADDLVDRGYQVLVSEWFPIKRYGSSGDTHRWRRLRQYPTELADTNAWGNLIAARSVEQLIPAAHRAISRAKWRYRLERAVRHRRVASSESVA